MKIIRPSFTALTIGLALGTAPVQGNPIVLKTESFRYEISKEGRSIALVDTRNGTNYVTGQPVPAAIVVQQQKRHASNAVRIQGNRLFVSFSDTDVTAVIRVERHPSWLVFQLVELSGKGKSTIDELVFPNISVSLAGRRAGTYSGIVRSPRFAVGCQALNLQTNSRMVLKGRPVWLRGQCFRRFGLVGARVALFAARNDQILDVVQEIERAEPRVPHVTLGGIWARHSPDARKSYLFIDMTESNADEVIRIASTLNFGYILVYANTWATSLGSYPINRKSFPQGMESFKRVASKAHKAGLKVGIHCLTGFVNKRDPLATPTPDHRLAKDGLLHLAADVDARARFIPTVESPADFPSDVAYGGERQGLEIQIDDEIISYRGLSAKPPFGLEKCIRGAYGTRCSPHRKGAPVYHLTQRYSNYLADCDTDLALRIAERYADVINRCQLDMIYFDGASANLAFGKQWRWRYVQQIPLQSSSLWQREVRVGGSCSGPLYWHLQAFKTCNDFVEIAVKRFLDCDKLRGAVSAQQNDIPVDLGWWGLHTWAPHRRATTPDEIEYICQKAVGFDACWSLETTLEKIHSCGRWPDIEPLIARYERLRLKRQFADSVKQALRRPGAEFKLVRHLATEGPEAQWQLVAVKYEPAHLVLGSKTRSWHIVNDWKTQPIRLRLYALPMLSPYASRENPVLLDQADLSRYVKSRVNAHCQTTLEATKQQTPNGEACVLFSAENDRNDAGGWVEHRADLVRLGQRIVPPALIEGLPEQFATRGRWARPLGVWIYGDGKGEVLNIQLRCANGGYRDHYVDVDFDGWKYCELTRPETDRVFDFNAGYSRKHAVRHFQYDRITNVFLRYNALPPHSTVQCLIGPIKALREHWLPIKDPAITIGSRTIVFPCRLETEQYLEYDGSGKARLYDREGREIGRVTPRGTTPILETGENQISYTSDNEAAYSQRADITIIRLDKQVPEKSP